MLSDDDLDLREMTPDEIEKAWDLWFELAQETNDFDPPYTHGVFVTVAGSAVPAERPAPSRPPGR